MQAARGRMQACTEIEAELAKLKFETVRIVGTCAERKAQSPQQLRCHGARKGGGKIPFRGGEGRMGRGEMSSSCVGPPAGSATDSNEARMLHERC
eukprot:4778042-Pleurochrysis_carterae.AAC.1